VTEETFKKWTEERAKRKAAELEAKRVEEAKRTGTKGLNVLSGRALFAYDPSLFVDDEGADDDKYSVQEEEAPESAIGGAGVAVDEEAFLDGADDLDDVLEDDEEDGEAEEEGGDEEEEDGEEGGEDEEEEAADA
jgi:hypothetical protein